jgi:hypothetical protein
MQQDSNKQEGRGAIVEKKVSKEILKKSRLHI